MALEARLIGPNDKDLLDAAVNAALYPNWPTVKPGPDVDKSDEVTADTILKTIKKKPEGVREFAVVIGENLDDPQTRKIAGISNGLYFPRSGTALPTYVFPTPEMRGNSDVEAAIMRETYKGIKKLAQETGRPINAVFVELLSPDAAETPEDRADAEKTLQYYTGDGINARDVGAVCQLGHKFAYANPHWDNDLDLHSLPDNNGQYARPQDVRGLVEDLSAHWFTKSVQRKAGYRSMHGVMMEQIGQMENNYEPGGILREPPHHDPNGPR